MITFSMPRTSIHHRITIIAYYSRKELINKHCLNEKPPKGAKYCITSEGWKLCQTSKMTGNSKMPVRSLSENIYDVGHQHLNTNSYGFIYHITI